MSQANFRVKWGTAAFATWMILGMSWMAPQTAKAIPIEVAASPASNLSLILAAVQSAGQEIQINIYEMTSPDLTNLLVSKIQAGVTVQILEEGQPFGSIPANEQTMTNQIVQAMQSASNSNNRFLLMTNQQDPSFKRRFVYDHAKYMVIDQQSAFVGSENYSASGQPRAGSKGTRGWEVFVHSPELASYFEQIYTSDANPTEGDIQVLYGTNASMSYGGNYSSYRGGTTKTNGNKKGGGTTKTGTSPASDPAPLPGGSDEYSSGDVDTVSPVVAPTTSQVGLINLIRSATSTLDIEQYTFESLWKTSRQNSPILQEVIAAAQRGVTVRVLMNDDTTGDGNMDGEMSAPFGTAFGGSTTPQTASMNTTTMQAINQAASQQNLHIQARIANLNAMGVYYVHNKGVLVDGNKTLVSSINWTENAITNNREAALILSSTGVYEYYENLFNQDWNLSQ